MTEAWEIIRANPTTLEVIECITWAACGAFVMYIWDLLTIRKLEAKLSLFLSGNAALTKLIRDRGEAGLISPTFSVYGTADSIQTLQRERTEKDRGIEGWQRAYDLAIIYAENEHGQRIAAENRLRPFITKRKRGKHGEFTKEAV
jgi:hypothetical protein